MSKNQILRNQLQDLQKNYLETVIFADSLMTKINQGIFLICTSKELSKDKKVRIIQSIKY